MGDFPPLCDAYAAQPPHLFMDTAKFPSGFLPTKHNYEEQLDFRRRDTRQNSPAPIRDEFGQLRFLKSFGSPKGLKS
jgi:hypothetical protein